MRSPLKKPAGEARVYVTVLRESVIHPGSPPSRSFSSPNETTPKQETMHRFPLFPVSGGGREEATVGKRKFSLGFLPAAQVPPRRPPSSMVLISRF